MGLPLLSPSAWYTVLLALALELGCWGVALLVGAYWTQRRWHESTLALLPVAAFVWVLLLARGVQAQATYWANYLSFQATYYPADAYPELSAQTREEYSAVVANINQNGWATIGVTEGLVLVGGLLLLRWRQPVRHEASEKPEKVPVEVDDANNLEITIEPMSQLQGDDW